ncbi:MAG: response regulator [Armatimonadetes bacterium]|nr:ATP-binding protein [Planctomycetota bacterium]NUP98426.1 response regulator [Armatimonadota bacterium]
MTDSDRESGKGISTRRGALRVYIVAVVLALTPVALLCFYGWRMASDALVDLVAQNNLAAATTTKKMIETEFALRTKHLQSFAEGSLMVNAVLARDEEAARGRLELLVSGSIRVDRAFVTDPDGRLWSDFPRAPESLGKNFADRDWFKGISSNWQPYVSNVYRRNAEANPLLVAIAAPIFDPKDHRVAGCLVTQIRLEGIASIFRSVEVGKGGHVLLLDHTGAVITHPKVDLQARRYDEYAASSPVLSAQRGEIRNLQYTDPISNEEMLAAALPCHVAGSTWTVIAQQPISEAIRPVRLLALEIGAAGAFLAILGVVLFSGLAKYHRRTQRLGTELAAANRDLLAEIDKHRLTAEELRKASDELEDRVAQRTQELQATRDQLIQAQKMEAIGRLAGGVAHDFNNLLTIILGYSELILADWPNSDPKRKQLDEIRKAGERARALTRQLLAFSRKQVLNPVILDFNAQVKHMHQMLARLIGEDVELVTNLAPDLARVVFDPTQVEQILLNLAVNARDAMPHGGRLTIETANKYLEEDYCRVHEGIQPGAYVVLTVTDTGEGMSKETRLHIFEPFFTTKEKGRGTGLGLSTVYGIVQQSGGHIWVYSEPGQGATFKIFLPATEAPAAKASRAALPAVRRGSATILVAEDDHDVRALICTVLKGNGYHVLDGGGPEGTLALSRGYADAIHLLLTDVVMPQMSGRQLAETLKAERPDLKVLYMSGYTDNAIVHRGVLEPGTEFIEKPVQPDSLLRKVQEVLDKDSPA